MSFSKDNSLKAKGIGVLMLIFHHLFFNKARFGAYSIVPWFMTEDRLIHIATAARICVWIFVFVSAYGLTTLYEKRVDTEGALCFVFRRWVSLMKGFWFVYVLVFAVLMAMGLRNYSFY